MKKPEFLEKAELLSKPLAEALKKDYINKLKPVPDTIIELINYLLTHKKK